MLKLFTGNVFSVNYFIFYEEVNLILFSKFFIFGDGDFYQRYNTTRSVKVPYNISLRRV